MTKSFLGNKKQRQFGTCFFIVSMSLFLFMYLNQQKVLSQPVNYFTANCVKSLSNFFGFKSEVKQTTLIRHRGIENIYIPTTLLTVKNYTARIILECSAVHTVILLLAFFFSMPSPIRHKIIGTIVFVPIIVAFNIIRIFLLMMVGNKFGSDSSTYIFFHIYIMRFFMFILVLLSSFLWLRSFESKKHDNLTHYIIKFIPISSIILLICFYLRKIFVIDDRLLYNYFCPLILFVSLILSSSNLKIQKDFKEISYAFGVLLLTLFFLQRIYVSYVNSCTANWELFYVISNSTFIYIMPFGLFFLLIRKKIMEQTDMLGNTIYTCPICGKKNIKNLVAHSKAKHLVELRNGNKTLLNTIEDR